MKRIGMVVIEWGAIQVQDFYMEIQDSIDWLSQYGKDPEGGITRLLYTKPWLDAQNALKDRLESMGMETKFDSIGNLFGRVKGSEHPDKTIATGSHIDTVINGGQLDGQLGIIGGMLAIKNLVKKYGEPKKNLEIISMAEEEGSRFPYVFWGSKNIFGLANKEDVIEIKDNEGNYFVDEMRKCGFDFKQDDSPREDIEAFIELHIEQGNFLEMENKSVGIITSIAGQVRYEVVLKGQSNHAGTTLMKYRKDTIEAYSKIVSNSLISAKEEGDPLVLTFGHITVKPNTVNVVPGETLFTIDCRHTNSLELSKFTGELEERMKDIAYELGIKIEINK